MTEIIDLLWEREKNRLYITREQFEMGFDGCEFDVLRRHDGSPIAVFVIRGPEFHFTKFGDDQCSREHLNKYPGSLIARHGYATTKTPVDDTRQQRFNERLGFYETGRDDLDIHYRIDHLRKKETPCQL